MHLIIKATNCIILLLLITGCSSQYQPNSLIAGDHLPLDQPSDEEENIVRYLADVEDHHALGLWYETSLSGEGNGYQESILVDCIACSNWENPSEPESFYNYILVCDSKNKWYSSTNYPKTAIFSIPPNVWRNKIFETNLTSYPHPHDPDACEMVEHNNYLWTFVYDGSDNKIRGFRCPIITSGQNIGRLDTPITLQYFNPLNCDNIDIDHITGLAWIPLDQYGNSWHLVCCDYEGNQVVILEQDGDVVFSYTTYGTDRPSDACIIQFDDYCCWSVYVTVEESSDRHQDYIHCYYRDDTYGYYAPVILDASTGSDYFEFILGISVRKFNEIEEDGTGQTSICFLMWDIDDLDGYRLRQGYCGRSSDDYYRFTEEFDIDYFEDSSLNANSVLVKAKSLALGKMSEGKDPEDCWVWGNKYLIADQDPLLTDVGEFSPDNRALDGRNVRVFSNSTNIFCD